MGDNKSINTKTPKIRFKEFAREWQLKYLSDIFIEINERIGNRDVETYSITAGNGFISQRKKFGRDISGSQNSNYTLLKPYDFSYNKGNSKKYKYGCIYVNNLGIDIAVPSVFISFRLKDSYMSTGFFAKYFESHVLDRGLRKIISSTARMDGLLNVNKDNFFGLNIYVPEESEQKKIAQVFIYIDELLSVLNKKIILLKKYKRGVMQSLYSQEIRFKNSKNEYFDSWQPINLSSVLRIRGERNGNNINSEVFSVAKNAGVINQIEHLGKSYAGKNTSNYKKVMPGDIVYTKSPTSDFPYGIIKQNKLDRDGIVSVLYAVYVPTNKYIGYIIDNYFSSWVNTFNYLNPIVKKGAKNTINIGDNDFLVGAQILLPTNIEEQKIISTFLENIDIKISAEEVLFDTLNKYKKALQEDLFV